MELVGLRRAEMNAPPVGAVPTATATIARAASVVPALAPVRPILAAPLPRVRLQDTARTVHVLLDILATLEYTATRIVQTFRYRICRYGNIEIYHFISDLN